MPVERTCKICGEKFYVKPYVVRDGRGFFCSNTCRGKWISENLRGPNSPSWQGGKVEIICEECGKNFRVRSSREGKARFCSMDCYGKWRSEKVQRENNPNWKGGEVKLICEWCEKEFHVTPSMKDGSRFCSYVCYGKWRSQNVRGESHPLWKEKVKIICEQCGQTFEVPPSHAVTRFCSRFCHGRWQSENLRRENHPAWKGGKSLEPYGPEWHEILREAVRKRDDYTCAISGEVWQPGEDKFPVHHCDYDKTNNNPDNLITLAQSSHARTNTNRRHWQALLTHAARGAEMRANAFIDGI